MSDNFWALREYGEVSSVCGVIDLFRARSLLAKAFWTILVLVAFGVTVWQTYGTFRDYINDETHSTTISVINMDGIPFPNVTICNFNRIRQSFVDKYNINRHALYYAFGTLPESYSMSLETFITKEFDILELERTWNELAMQLNITDVSQLMSISGHTCEETFLQCIFAFEPFSCCSRIEEKINANGKCFILMPISPSGNKQLIPGKAGGLKLTLNPLLHEYLVNVSTNNFLEQGFLVNIGYVYEPMVSSPTVLRPNSHTWISLSASRTIMKKSQYPIYKLPCRDNSELKFLNENYTKLNCFFDCQISNEINQCGCSLVAQLKPPHSICNGTRAFECANKKQSTNSSQDCLKSCTQLCDTTYSVGASLISSTEFSMITMSNALSEKLKKKLAQLNRTYDVIETKNLIAVDIFFPTLELNTIVTSETTQIFIFISNIGGQLGLWLGITMVTVVQALYYLTILITEWIRKKPQQKTDHGKSNNNFSEGKQAES